MMSTPTTCLAVARSPGRPARRDLSWRVLELTALELDEIATALPDQSDYERRLLINTTNGELVFWTQDIGIDGYQPIDLEDLDRTW